MNTCFKVLSQYLGGIIGKNHNRAVRIAGFEAEMQTYKKQADADLSTSES